MSFWIHEEVEVELGDAATYYGQSLQASNDTTRGVIEQIRKNLSEAKFEILEWTIGTTFAPVGIFETIVKIWH